MTTPALDAAVAADFVGAVRLIRIDLPSGVVLRWATVSMQILRAGDGTYHPIDDTYGTLLNCGSISQKLAEHGAFDLTVHATPALTSILQAQGATRSRVRAWDVAINLDTGALIDTDAPDFDGWIADRARTVAEQGDTWEISCIARTIRSDDPDQSALMNDATQARYWGDNADRFFEYVQVLPETLPWGTAASSITAPPRQGGANFAPPPGDGGFYTPTIEFR